MADEFDFVGTDSDKLYTEIIGSLMDHCDEALYPGDERRIFGEALVAVLVAAYSEFNDKAKQRTLRYARGPVLDALAERCGISRLEPAYARTTIRFEVSEIRGERIIIPAGTRVTNDGSVYFATEDTDVLPAGSNYVLVNAVCSEPGAAHNGYAPGTFCTLVDQIPYIVAAYNYHVSMSGDDGEPYTTDGDDSLRERIRLATSAISAVGTEQAYRYHTLSLDSDIIDVAVVPPSVGNYAVTIYPLVKDGGTPDDETLMRVQLEFGSDSTKRPLSDYVRAKAPEPVEFGIELKYYFEESGQTAVVQAIEGEGGAIDKYLEWQTSALGRDIDPDQLRIRIFEAFAACGASGTIRIDMVSPGYTEVGKTQFAKFNGSMAVSHEAVYV